MPGESRNHIYGGDGVDHRKSHRRKRRLTLVISICAVLLVGGGVVTALILMQPKKVDPVQTVVKTPEPEPEPVIYYSPLSGRIVENEAATKRAVTAVMIENSPNARPQSGLKEGDVIFEAIAEGGITRFMVLYQDKKPALIGPVRSARLYDIEWLNPFNASLAHVGGSARALGEVRNGKYRDLDQFFNASYYWRTTDRYAPHNVYTSFAKLNELNKAKGYTSSTFTGFDRADSSAAEEPDATKLNVTISSATYNSSYTYVKKTNTYNRIQAGAAHVDREKGQISPRVVIVMKVKETTVFEDGWRENIKTIGSGTAYIFQDGTAQKVTWHKPAKNKQIYFTDKEGERVSLARGQTWITAVPSDTGGVTWS